MTDRPLPEVMRGYLFARPLGDAWAIVAPLTFGRWRLSRATEWAVLDGY